jgi:hypothetical protein
MAFLAERDQEAVRKEFQRVSGPVKLVVFSQELVAAIDRERAEAYGVDQVPAIVVEGARDYGIRFLGIPGGYEFSNLIDSIIAASSGQAALSDATKASLAELKGDVHIKVFSTPT